MQEHGKEVKEMNSTNLAIILLLVGSFGCGLYAAVKNSAIYAGVGVILLTVAVLISVVGH